MSESSLNERMRRRKRRKGGNMRERNRELGLFGIIHSKLSDIYKD